MMPTWVDTAIARLLRGGVVLSIAILVAGNGERRTLRLVAQYADMCNVYGAVEEVAHRFEVLRQHCAAAGFLIARQAGARLLCRVHSKALHFLRSVIARGTAFRADGLSALAARFEIHGHVDVPEALDGVWGDAGLVFGLLRHDFLLLVDMSCTSV